MSKTSPSLGNIPDDLVLDILKHLDTARDVAHFEASSKWTRRLVRQSGWRDFVKTRFSSLAPLRTSGVSDDEGCWASLADRLTYQDRCWNRRGFYLTAYDEIPPQGRGGARRNFAGQSVGFQSVMAAAAASSGLRQEEELFVFGAGEDILFRRRPTSSETRDVWAKLTGHETGYTAGTGDVTALSILERGTAAAATEVVVGRATGELQLLSADFASLGESPQALLPLNEPTIGSRTSPGQVAVSWTEWEPRNQILASCRNSTLTLYNLSPSTEEEPSLQPIAFYDAANRNLPSETSFMRSAKFMAPDVLACGLGGTSQPLRWARLRPEGAIEVFNAARNSQVAKSSAPERGPDDKTTVRAIEPVRGMNPNVLLSAWDDGSHRLSDLRTPSEHDAVYRDRFQLYQASSCMLVYGAERFVAGNNWSPSIRLFDFRSPRSYEHHNALPCSPHAPVPSRPMQKDKLLGLEEPQQPLAARCQHESGRRCVWHDLSSQHSWRPDAMLHMGGPSLDRVYSLSKASDTSTSFHVGFRGSFTEITLGLTSHVPQEAKSRTAPEGWRAMQPRDKVSLMETGVGLYKGEEDLVEECMGVPRMYFHRPSQRQEEEEEEEEEMVDGRAGLSRLDGAYRTGHGRRVWE